MSKGSKRRPCCIPSWLEEFRWSRATASTLRGSMRAILRGHLDEYPDDRKYLTDAELELLNEN